jgi:hypothetical protein
MSLLNRASLRRLSQARVADAQVLLANSRFSAAYYIAGYGVECALKARIAQNTRKSDFPDKALVNNSHTHDLGKLMGLAGLIPKLDLATSADSTLQNYWLVAKDWSEQSRYNVSIDKQTAQDLLTAITDPTHGVLAWIEKN